jgi:hypothetical protein
MSGCSDGHCSFPRSDTSVVERRQAAFSKSQSAISKCFSVLRIRDVYPGSECFPTRIPDPHVLHPGSECFPTRIPDPHVLHPGSECFPRVFWAPNGTRLSARCHFTGPKKLSNSRAQPPPTSPHNGYARIQNIIIHRCIDSYFAIYASLRCLIM